MYKVPDKMKFDGKTYHLATAGGSGYGTKTNAKEVATRARNRGLKARVVKIKRKGFSEHVVYTK